MRKLIVLRILLVFITFWTLPIVAAAQLASRGYLFQVPDGIPLSAQERLYAADPMQRRFMRECVIRRSIERNNSMIRASNLALVLAEQLKDEVAAQATGVHLDSLANKAEEIQKMAKAVRENMRGEW